MYYLNLLKYRLSLKHSKHDRNVIALIFFFFNDFFSYCSIILLSLFTFNIFKLFRFQHATHSEPATSKVKYKRKEEIKRRNKINYKRPDVQEFVLWSWLLCGVFIFWICLCLILCLFLRKKKKQKKNNFFA